MSTTGTRTLQLLSLLQNHRYWPGAELAARLGVSVRTLRRDVDRLRELGYPVDAQRGVDGGYQLIAGASLPPLVLDDEEAVALAVGLQMSAQDDAVAGIAESSVRVLTKVIQVMPARLRQRVDNLRAMTVAASWDVRGPTVDATLLTLIAQLCRDSERLGFDYTAASGAESARDVEPHRLVMLGRRWYLVAWDRDRSDWRSFRLDRIDAPRTTGARFNPRVLPAADAAAFVQAGIGGLQSGYAIVARVHAPAAVIGPQVGRWAEIEAVDADHCILRMTADSLDWPALALGATGAEFEVLSPPEMQDYVREWAGRFARAVPASISPRGTTPT
jgi:predicted DNA-binding transcriptional regulator YafY